jgi:hypothetical protein
MKKFTVLIILGLLMSCGLEDATPTMPVEVDFDETSATLLSEGNWMGSGGYDVNGTAQIFEDRDKKVLLFTDFMSSNGPDLKVYLSTDMNASSFVNLGKLKSTNGNQTYEILDGTDLEEFKFALIWCERFSVLFGKAENL